MLLSQMYLADEPLRRWIKAYWLVEGDGRSDTYHRYDLIPDGCATLMLILDGSLRLPWYQESRIGYGVYIVPPNAEPFDNLISDDIYHIDIQLNPGVFFYLFNIPPEELGNRIYPAEELSLRIDPDTIEKLISRRNDIPTLIRTLDAWMLGLFCGRGFESDRLLFGVNDLYLDGNLDRFFLNQSLSIRQLERNVRTATGLTPKTISRIGRFYGILEQMKAHPERQKIAYTELETRFADQSHFIREFKSFTGVPPNRFLARSENYLQYCGLCSYHLRFESRTKSA
ncbi:MAG: DUF6597 domain-containing transcriptional factor [Sulfuricurvum sp.]